jgi:hypothetical protein
LEQKNAGTTVNPSRKLLFYLDGPYTFKVWRVPHHILSPTSHLGTCCSYREVLMLKGLVFR